MKNEDNIIMFPKQKKITNDEFVSDEFLKQNENLSSSLLEMKINHINDTLFLILPKLFQNIDLAGGMTEYYTESMDLQEFKDINLIIEAIRALLYKRYQLEHPLQKMSEEIFMVTDDGLINMKENINLNFNQKQKTDDTD